MASDAMSSVETLLAKLDQLDKQYVRGAPLSDPRHTIFAHELIAAWPVLRKLAMDGLALKSPDGK